MSDEFILATIMLGCLCSLVAVHLLSRLVAKQREKQRQLDAHTDAQMRIGFRNLTPEQVLRLLDDTLDQEQPPIRPVDFRITERGHETRFQRLPEDVA